MGKLLIGGGRTILPDGIHDGVNLLCENGVITEITSALPEADERIDAGGMYVSPGFIDMHVHGGGGHDFLDGTPEAFLGAARIHATHGTTSMLPTTCTCSDEDLSAFIRAFREARRINTDGAQMLGIHLEGPFFSPGKAGAQDPRYLKLPTRENFLPMLEEGGSDILRVSAAPELEGAMELGRELRSRGILAAIGHTDATDAQCEEAFRNGYSLMTHFYCAMSSVVRINAYRYAGAVEAGYLIDDMDIEIIADGVHLPQSLLRFVCKFKDHGRIALITDSMRAAGMPDGTYKIGSLRDGQDVVKEDGVAKLPDRSAFAGSVATTDRLVRTMTNLAGIDLADAVRMASANPARMLGIDARKGSLAPGLDADIVLFDENITIAKTIISGNVIYNS